MITHRDTMARMLLVLIIPKGTVKRLHLSRCEKRPKRGIKGACLDEGDELISVRQTTEHDYIIATHNGMPYASMEGRARHGRAGRGRSGIR